MYPQLQFLERVKYSNSANSDEKALFLVDFWATWCAPCITVSKYLNVLQQEFPEDLYIVSLTYENADLVTKFLDKHPTQLSVSVDNNRENFEKYGIEALPHGMLFDARGNILWRGNPADLKADRIRMFLKKSKGKIAINNFITHTSSSVAGGTVAPDNEFKLPTAKEADYTIEKVKYANSEPQVSKYKEYTVVKGTLSDILSFLLKVNKKQLTNNKAEEDTFTLYLKDNLQESAEGALINKILRDGDLRLREKRKYGEVYRIVSRRKDMFWDTTQIDWGDEYRAAFMVDDSDLIADNVSFKVLLYKLSNLLEKPIVWRSDRSEVVGVNDWNVHYKYENLMKMSLEEYGIEIQKEKADYPMYSIE